MIRDVRARQEVVRATLEDEEEAFLLPFIASMMRRDGGDAVLQSIRKALDLNLDQYRGRGNRGPVGFAYLREQAEKAGIFVLLIGNPVATTQAWRSRCFAGCAGGQYGPLVVINDQDSETAWAFTQIRELSHICLGATGVSGASAETEVEQFCNEVAGRFRHQRPLRRNHRSIKTEKAAS